MPGFSSSGAAVGTGTCVPRPGREAASRRDARPLRDARGDALGARVGGAACPSRG